MIPDPVPLKLLALAAALAVAAGCAHDQRHLLHRNSGPVITGNPAADSTLPPRLGRPGRLLLRCALPADRDSARWGMYASAQSFDEGRQSFYLKRTDTEGGETLYPLHGHFLDGGSSGIFMVHDGRGAKNGQGDAFLIDQSVNMGVLFFRATGDGARAILDVFAEERENGASGAAQSALEDYFCRQGEAADTPVGRHAAQPGHVRMQPNSGATPPSHWLRESDKTLLTCSGTAVEGEYRFELLGSQIWPGHLGFLVVRAPGKNQPVGYNVHLLAGAGRLLIHTHSYPHRTRERILDTMEETETVIGGLLLVKTESGYAGWAGLAGSAADPYNIAFSTTATMADYAAQGRAVVSPLPVTCQ
jgi:hypothetical protein